MVKVSNHQLAALAALVWLCALLGMVPESTEQPIPPEPGQSYVWVDSVYDGDTFHGDIMLGCGVVLHDQGFRLYGVNTPEMRGGTEETKQKARLCQKWLNQRIDDRYVLVDFKLVKGGKRKGKRDDGKYGRWLVVVGDYNQKLREMGYPSPESWDK